MIVPADHHHVCPLVGFAAGTFNKQLFIADWYLLAAEENDSHKVGNKLFWLTVPL